MKRTSTLRQRTPLRRKTRLRARSLTNSYRHRERDVPFMLFVKSLTCAVSRMPPDPHRVTACSRGPSEADHLGSRGIGQKADDRTCGPMCSQHHRERTDHSGCFRDLDQAALRLWRARVIEDTTKRWTRKKHA